MISVMRYLAIAILAGLAVSCDQDVGAGSEFAFEEQGAVEVPGVEVQDTRPLQGPVVEHGDLLAPLPRYLPDGTLARPKVYLACLVVTWKLADEAGPP